MHGRVRVDAPPRLPGDVPVSHVGGDTSNLPQLGVRHVVSPAVTIDCAIVIRGLGVLLHVGAHYILWGWWVRF